MVVEIFGKKINIDTQVLHQYENVYGSKIDLNHLCALAITSGATEKDSPEYLSKAINMAMEDMIENLPIADKAIIGMINQEKQNG